MKSLCYSPFERFTIQPNGNVNFCCPAYNNNYFIGNIFTDEIDDIWYGKKAIEFRKSILDGSYKYCNLDICEEKTLHPFKFNNKDYDSYLLSPKYPKVIHLSYCTSCNVMCKMCRDNPFFETKEDTEYFNKFNDKIVKLCQNAELIYLNGNGELFTSPHLKSLVQRLTKTYPKLRFEIHSNGLLCDEAHLKEYGLDGKVDIFNISIHAATKETYESIVRGGHWEQLQKNLKYLSSLNCTLNLLFVLHSLNYKEMPAFAKMTNSLGGSCFFWRFRDWYNTQMCHNIDMYSCWEPWHPDYKDFLKVLNKLKRMKKYKYCLQEEFLRKLQSQTTDPWWVKFTKFF